jgi:hypothetical protein
MIFLYIDPGTGMIILQILLAALASILIFFKKIMAKIKSYLKKK